MLRIFFNCIKSAAVLFELKQFCVSASPINFLSTNTVSFSNDVKYLGVKLNDLLSDDDNIYREIRTIYGTANRLKISFSQCSTSVKMYYSVLTIRSFILVNYGVII